MKLSEKSKVEEFIPELKLKWTEATGGLKTDYKVFYKQIYKVTQWSHKKNNEKIRQTLKERSVPVSGAPSSGGKGNDLAIPFSSPQWGESLQGANKKKTIN